MVGNIDEVKLDIKEFIDFSKQNGETYTKESKKVEEKFKVEVDSEGEYYTATMNGMSTPSFNGKNFELTWEATFTCDWNGEDFEIDSYKATNEDIPEEMEDGLDDELSECIDGEVSNFVSEYAVPFDKYYDDMKDFWIKKGYDDVEFDETMMTITGDGFIIKTSNWNQDSIDEFDIEVNEDEN